MGSASNRRALALGAVALSAALFWFSTGLDPLWWPIWFAPLPVLLVAPRLSGRLAFVAAFAARSLGGLCIWPYLAIPLPAVVILAVLVVVPSIVFGACVVLYRAHLERDSLWQAGLALPCIWIAFEYLSAVSSPHGTYGSLGYSQMDFLPVIQVASLAGPWAIGFCVLLFSSASAVLLSGKPGRAAVAGVSAALLILVLGFGVWRLQSTPSSPTVTVGLIGSDRPENMYPRTQESSLAVFQRYVAQVPALAAQGARIVVMPEHLGALVDTSLQGRASDVDRLFSEAARQNDVFLVVGVDRVVTRKLLFNEARLYSPGGPIATYHKRHLLPGPESVFTPGRTDFMFGMALGTAGIAICKDLDFPALGRGYALGRTDLMLVPALDFRLDGWLHGRMAILRGVEGGFSMARAANLGRLTLSDDRGRVLAERASDSAPFATLVGAVPVRHDPTLYSRTGDWFAWLVLILVGSALATTLLGYFATRHDQ